MSVIDNFVGRRKKKDNAYLHEVKNLIADFIVDRSVEIAHCIQTKNRGSLEDEIEKWLSKD